MNIPKAVLISDIHFNINNLPYASTALRHGLIRAEDYRVPLIIAGDLNDTKDIIRGKVINELLDILKNPQVLVYLLVGNHDKINEKSDEHTLNFLAPYVRLIDGYHYDRTLDLHFIAYQSDLDRLRLYLQQVPPGSTVIMHQGFKGAQMGEYIVDHSSIDPEEVAHLRVISGHYHSRQTVGTVEYIGTPYTMSFAEAKDGLKGIRVLHSDNSLSFLPLNIRKHIIVNRTVEDIFTPIKEYCKGDLVWVKLSGSWTELKKIQKKQIGDFLFGHNNFKLDLIPTGNVEEPKLKEFTDFELFDNLIDNLSENKTTKVSLKTLWKEIVK